MFFVTISGCYKAVFFSNFFLCTVNSGIVCLQNAFLWLTMQMFFFLCRYLFPFFLFPLGFPICFSSLFSSLFCNSISSNGFSALFELNLSENKRKEKSTFALPAQSFYLPISMVERFINAWFLSLHEAGTFWLIWI